MELEYLDSLESFITFKTFPNWHKLTFKTDQVSAYKIINILLGKIVSYTKHNKWICNEKNCIYFFHLA